MEEMLLLLVLLILVIVPFFTMGIIGMCFGTTKGHPWAGFFLGLFFGPLGWILVLLLPKEGLRCPYCCEVVHPNAVICPHCRSDISD